MKSSAKKRKPEIIIRDGKPTAVILDIEEYREMLEHLEDVQDIKMLAKMRARKLSFRKLGDFLESRRKSV